MVHCFATNLLFEMAILLRVKFELRQGGKTTRNRNTAKRM